MIKLIGPITRVDSTTPAYEVGGKTVTKDGNEYIYLPGTDSVAQYDWVVFRTASKMSYGSVSRLTTALSGPVAIAQAAITSNKYGWFARSGVFWGKCGNTVSAGGTLYASGTTAAVDSIFQAGVNILGGIAVDAGTGASGGTVKVLIDYPFIPGVAV